MLRQRTWRRFDMDKLESKPAGNKRGPKLGSKQQPRAGSLAYHVSKLEVGQAYYKPFKGEGMYSLEQVANRVTLSRIEGKKFKQTKLIAVRADENHTLEILTKIERIA